MAVLLTGVALHRTGVLRRVGLVVAVLAGAILLLDALTRGFPPFVVALLWLTVGIALLRRREPSPR
jgi:xanthine/uracil permease